MLPLTLDTKQIPLVVAWTISQIRAICCGPASKICLPAALSRGGTDPWQQQERLTLFIHPSLYTHVRILLYPVVVAPAVSQSSPHDSGPVVLSSPSLLGDVGGAAGEIAAQRLLQRVLVLLRCCACGAKASFSLAACASSGSGSIHRRHPDRQPSYLLHISATLSLPISSAAHPPCRVWNSVID